MILISVLIFTMLSKAQDPHFSQFFSSPLTLNPAYTGKFDGKYRLAVNYKNQWHPINYAFTTSTFSADLPLLTNFLPLYDTWGIGIIGLNEQTANKAYNNNYLGISTAYNKSLDEDGFKQISLGFQGVFATKKLDLNRLLFEDQLTSYGFYLPGTTNPNPTGEWSNLITPNINYADLNAGIIYSATTTGDNNYYIGFSAYHVNRSREKFLTNPNNVSHIIKPRYTVHGGGYTPIGQYKTLHGSFIHQIQGGTSETVLGAAMSANVNYDFNNPTEVYLGLWYRVKDAIIPYFGYEFSNIRIGVSYDINLSKLTTSSYGRGGTEISLIYIHREMGQRRINCPKF